MEAVVGRRSIGGIEPAGGWVVTSPHQVKLSGETWLPFGRQHAVAPGSEATLCGRRAYAWPTFLDLAFDPEHDKACAECATASLSSSAEVTTLVSTET